MPRLTRKLFSDLAIWMIAFGLLIGAGFPFFTLVLGMPQEQVMTLHFYGASIGAGVMAGGLNFLLARTVVRPRLRLLAHRMHVVGDAIRRGTYADEDRACTKDECLVQVDSADELGDAAEAFNALVEAIFRSYEVESAVSDFSRALSSELDRVALTTVGLKQLLSHTGAAAGAVLVKEGGELVVTASHGLTETAHLADSDHIRHAIRTGEMATIEFPAMLRVEALLTAFQPAEAHVVPIRFKQAPLGVVVLASSQPFTQEACKLLELFRQSFGLALNNALAHHDMKRMAALDVLTGAYNRRFGLSRLHEEFTRAVRAKSTLGLMMIDLDHFKEVNDTYGHLVGDRVLAGMAEAIRKGLREGDVMVRYGGEELMIILPGGSIANCRQIGERVRQMASHTEFTDGTQAFNVSISVGVASYPELDVEREQDLIGAADEALYTAKHQGRDQLVSAC